MITTGKWDTVDWEIFAVKIFSRLPQMRNFFLWNLFNSEWWSQGIIMVLWVFSTAKRASSHERFDISSVHTTIFNVLELSYTCRLGKCDESIVHVSGGWAACQHLYYAGACMLKYFCEHFSLRKYLMQKIFMRNIFNAKIFRCTVRLWQKNLSLFYCQDAPRVLLAHPKRRKANMKISIL